MCVRDLALYVATRGVRLGFRAHQGINVVETHARLLVAGAAEARVWITPSPTTPSALGGSWGHAHVSIGMVCRSGAARTAPVAVTSVLALAVLAVRTSTEMILCAHPAPSAARMCASPTPVLTGEDGTEEDLGKAKAREDGTEEDLGRAKERDMGMASRRGKQFVPQEQVCMDLCMARQVFCHACFVTSFLIRGWATQGSSDAN